LEEGEEEEVVEKGSILHGRGQLSSSEEGALGGCSSSIREIELKVQVTPMLRLLTDWGGGEIRTGAETWGEQIQTWWIRGDQLIVRERFVIGVERKGITKRIAQIHHFASDVRSLGMLQPSVRAI
jgi:hypothetical protein